MSDERKDYNERASNDMDMLRQVRKSLNDIQVSFTINKPRKAEYQLYLLRTMIDEQPSRRKPWSVYQPMAEEEFSDTMEVYKPIQWLCPKCGGHPHKSHYVLLDDTLTITCAGCGFHESCLPRDNES